MTETAKAAVTTLPVARNVSVAGVDVFADSGAFEHAQRVAKVLASSALVPKHFQGNVADCLIALQIARRLNEEPMTVLQNLYVVSGRPGWSSAYMIARARRSGVFSGPITWRTAGQNGDLAVTAVAHLSDTGEEVTATADMRMAKAEGWTKNQKYASMPEHMLRWRSAAMLIRLYAPEVMIGLPIIEEVETEPAIAEPRDVTPPKSAAAALDAFAAEAETAAAKRDAVDAEEVQDSGAEITAAPDAAEPPAEAAPAPRKPKQAKATEPVAVPAEQESPAGRKSDLRPATGPAEWTDAECVAHGKAAAEKGMPRKAAVPGELRGEDQADRARLVLSGFDRAAAEANGQQAMV